MNKDIIIKIRVRENSVATMLKSSEGNINDMSISDMLQLVGILDALKQQTLDKIQSREKGNG